MRYRSCAQWPADTLNGHDNDISRVTNGTIKAARAVAKMLEEQGFPDWYDFKGPRTTGGRRRAGDGKVFPLRTWVQPVDAMVDPITFCDCECRPKLSCYQNRRRALSLWSDEEGPIAKVSVNIVEADCPAYEFYVKDWSENEGIATLLTEAGWIEPTGVVEPTGFVTAERYRFTVAFEQEYGR